MAYGPPPAPPPGPGGQPPWQQPQWQQPPPPGQYGPSPYGPGPGGPIPQPQEPPQQVPLGPPTHEETNWALMAYLGQFLTSAIAPAVILATKGGSPFVRAHARQGLNMALGAIAVWVVGILLIVLMDGLAFIPLAYSAAVMFFLVRAGMGANRGEFVRVPSFIAWPILK